VFLILALVSSWATRKRVESTHVSVESSSAYGLYTVQQFLFEDGKSSVEIWREPFLHPLTSPEGKQLLIVPPPIGRFSNVEVKHVSEFVSGGGAVWINAHEPEDLIRLGNLTQALELELQLEEDPHFKNYHVAEIAGSHFSPFFSEDETYMTYASYRWKNPECEMTEFQCIFHTATYGDGMIVVQSGLNLLSNSLISLSSNREVLFRLAEVFPSIAVDHYHQMAGTKTWLDLLLSPQFSLPLLGLLIMIYGFLIFARSPIQDQSLIHATPRKQMSSLNFFESLFLTHLKLPEFQKSSLRHYAKFLERKYPSRPIERDWLIGHGFMQKFHRLFNHHQSAAQKKRGIHDQHRTSVTPNLKHQKNAQRESSL